MRSVLFATLFLFLATSFNGCDLLSDSQRGSISINLTDTPFPFDDADSANAIIERVEFISSDDSSDVVILSEDAQAFNLLDLQNGITAPLATADLPDGNYSQLRFIVSEDASVVMSDSTVFDLKIPSGSQTGIKINLPAFDVGTSDIVEITVDFNVDQSFVVTGNPASSKDITGFIFKRVLKIESFSINEITETTEQQ